MNKTDKWFEFGLGKVVVTPGTHAEYPAVFIRPAITQGVVGASADRENSPRDRLVDGEIVLTFPTKAQAKAVETALLNVPERSEKI